MPNIEESIGRSEWPIVAVESGHMTTRGERIKRARKLRGMRQLDLALATGVGQRTIGRIERGERETTDDYDALENLQKLETYLGLTADTQGDMPVDAPTVTESTPTHQPPPGLSQYPLTALLAEALSRVAQFEGQTGVQITSHETPRRVRWATEDAPSARRNPDHPEGDIRGAK